MCEGAFFGKEKKRKEKEKACAFGFVSFVV
jgi:hypothetical protein